VIKAGAGIEQHRPLSTVIEHGDSATPQVSVGGRVHTQSPPEKRERTIARSVASRWFGSHSTEAIAPSPRRGSPPPRQTLLGGERKMVGFWCASP